MNMHYTPTSRSRVSGLTLVEVMIAMLLSVVLLGGVVQISSSTKASYRTNEAVAQLQENGRFATEILARDIRMADFWGCANNIGLVTNTLNPGAGSIDVADGGVNGTEGGGAPDTLVLRGGYSSGIQVEAPFGPLPSADIKVTPDNGLNQDDIVVISDCTSADVLQVTNAQPSTAGNIVHNTGTASPGNSTKILSKVYEDDATVYRAQEITYNIAVGSSGQPALFRNGLELVDGIEDLQILYGEDIDPPETAGSGSANYYVPADQVSNMNNVVSIRFALVARSYENNVANGQTYSVLGTSVTSADNRLRQVYTSTVGIRNRLN